MAFWKRKKQLEKPIESVEEKKYTLREARSILDEEKTGLSEVDRLFKAGDRMGGLRKLISLGDPKRQINYYDDIKWLEQRDEREVILECYKIVAKNFPAEAFLSALSCGNIEYAEQIYDFGISGLRSKNPDMAIKIAKGFADSQTLQTILEENLQKVKVLEDERLIYLLENAKTLGGKNELEQQVYDKLLNVTQSHTKRNTEWAERYERHAKMWETFSYLVRNKSSPRDLKAGVPKGGFNYSKDYPLEDDVGERK